MFETLGTLGLSDNDNYTDIDDQILKWSSRGSTILPKNRSITRKYRH